MGAWALVALDCLLVAASPTPSHLPLLKSSQATWLTNNLEDLAPFYDFRLSDRPTALYTSIWVRRLFLLYYLNHVDGVTQEAWTQAEAEAGAIVPRTRGPSIPSLRARHGFFPTPPLAASRYSDIRNGIYFFLGLHFFGPSWSSTAFLLSATLQVPFQNWTQPCITLSTTSGLADAASMVTGEQFPPLSLWPLAGLPSLSGSTVAWLRATRRLFPPCQALNPRGQFVAIGAWLTSRQPQIRNPTSRYLTRKSILRQKRARHSPRRRYNPRRQCNSRDVKLRRPSTGRAMTTTEKTAGRQIV